MNSPKILLLDCETSPNLAYVWGQYQQDVIKVHTPWEILAFAHKWLGEKKTYVLVKQGKTDESLIRMVWKLLDEADVVIAHNGDRFDLKKINTRFAFYNLKPPTPYKTIDTLKVARRHFAFNSNRLNDLGQFLHLGEKVKTGGFDLWMACIAGDPKAWRRMKRYNKKDVILLEKLYYHLLPWIQNHPNVGNFTDNAVCPKCGGSNLNCQGFALTLTMKYQRYKCRDCGGWCRGTTNLRTEKPLVNAA